MSQPHHIHWKHFEVSLTSSYRLSQVRHLPVQVPDFCKNFQKYFFSLHYVIAHRNVFLRLTLRPPLMEIFGGFASSIDNARNGADAARCRPTLESKVSALPCA